jgi:hypothetical protein
MVGYQRVSAVAVVVLVGLLVGVAMLASDADGGKERVRPQLRLADDEFVAAEFVISLPASSKRLIRSKVVDRATGRVREVTTDAATGMPAVLSTLARSERESWRRKHGGASRELVARLARASSEALLAVGIQWRAGGESALRRELERVGARILRTRANVLEVSIKAGALRRLLDRNVVDAAAPVPRVKTLAVDMARDLGQRAIDDAHRGGVGLGLINVVWELEACVRRTHPDFKSVQWLPRPGNTPCDHAADGNSGVVGHATMVAGALAADRVSNGTVGLYRAKLVEVDDTDQANVDRMWALNPTIVNASFTMTVFEALRVDAEVYRRGAYVFAGAGNDHNDTANCYAYNAICVGGYSGHKSVGQFTDDFVSAFSYLNLPSDNGEPTREFPTLVGPSSGEFARASGSGYTHGSGTSFATPAVAGTAGLMLTNAPLMSPALMRAVLIASAQAHQVAHSGPRIPLMNDGFDDRAGFGAPNGGRALKIIQGRSYFYDKTFEPQNLGEKATIKVNPRERVRVVAAWDQCPYTSVIDPQLTVDFDLVVNKPRITLPGKFSPAETYSNLSAVDNFEVVEFISEFGGTYHINISAPRWSTCAAEGNNRRARLALAWTKEHAPIQSKP